RGVVRHGHHVELRRVEKDGDVKMWAASYGGMAQVENARIFPDMVYELRDRIDRKARVNNEGRRPPDRGADWNEALLAPAKFRVYARVGHGRGAEERPGISVSWHARPDPRRGCRLHPASLRPRSAAARSRKACR